MESHPEEFRRDSETFHARWYDYVEGIKAYGSETDNVTITAKLRDIRLAEIHEHVMDELLNGPERRRKQEEEAEYERSLYASQLGRAQSQTIELQGGGGGGFAGIPIANGGTTTLARYPTSTDMENNGVVSALRKLIST
jgi:hypothetical protein